MLCIHTYIYVYTYIYRSHISQQHKRVLTDIPEASVQRHEGSLERLGILLHHRYICIYIAYLAINTTPGNPDLNNLNNPNIHTDNSPDSPDSPDSCFTSYRYISLVWRSKQPQATTPRPHTAQIHSHPLSLTTLHDSPIHHPPPVLIYYYYYYYS